MRTLGIYGPKFPERSGVANYTDRLEAELSRRYRCVRVSNDDWVDPSVFDRTLYQVGASIRHHCAFRALRLRPGPAVVHEHNCLSYYYEAWPLLEEEEREEFLRHLSGALGRGFDSLPGVLSCLDALADPDRYGADVGIEALFMRRITGAVVHSPYVASLLRSRYPGVRVETLPFMTTPLQAAAGERIRERLGLSAGDHLFGVFGFIGEYKRIEKVLAAWYGWTDRPAGTRLVIVGQRQYEVEVPVSPHCLYLDYLPDEEEFDAYLAAADCGVQLRHPTLGETSAVVSRLLANGRRVILSRTPFTSPYRRSSRVIRIPPDEREVPALIEAFRHVARLPRPPLRYNPAHHLTAYVRRLVPLIESAARVPQP
ncbi:MAG TPA: hypothetical protein VHG28_24515 [Longimicrobiaceae bacterium]|nr:hypothetical protein [Longimicrobiaceae bacterium]